MDDFVEELINEEAAVLQDLLRVIALNTGAVRSRNFQAVRPKRFDKGSRAVFRHGCHPVREDDFKNEIMRGQSTVGLDEFFAEFVSRHCFCLSEWRLMKVAGRVTAPGNTQS